MRRGLVLVPAVLLMAACSTADKSAATPADSTAAVASATPASAAPAPEAPKLSAAHQRVIQYLNQDGLISIPEVKAKSDALMAEIRQNKMTIAEGAEVFDKWLGEYVASHPKEVAEAKATRASQIEQAKQAAPGGANPQIAPRPMAAPGGAPIKPPTP